MKFILMFLVFLFGALQPFQAGMNARMGAQLGDRFQAGFMNGFVNVCLLMLVLFVLWRGFPSLASFRGAPWWAYLAGAIGAGIVVVQLSAAPVLGAGLLVCFFVAGQVFGSLTADTFGLVGYAVRPPSLLRITAFVLIVAGVVLATLSNESTPSDPKASEGVVEA